MSFVGFEKHEAVLETTISNGKRIPLAVATIARISRQLPKYWSDFEEGRPDTSQQVAH